MPTIYFCRHGQDEDNAEGLLNGTRDRPLTSKGKEQAVATAALLKGKGITKVFCSPMIRTTETATIIAGEAGLPAPVAMPEIGPRDFGVLTGKPKADIAKYSSNNIQTDSELIFLDPQGAEPFPAVYERAKKVIESLPSENVLLVSHIDVMKMLVGAANGTDWEVAVKNFYGNSEVAEVSK